jgi:hypothetical protein
MESFLPIGWRVFEEKVCQSAAQVIFPTLSANPKPSSKHKMYG